MVNEIVISKMEQRRFNPQLNDVEFNIHWDKLSKSEFYLHRIKKNIKIIFIDYEVDGYKIELSFDNIFNKIGDDILVVIVLKGNNVEYLNNKDFLEFLKVYSFLNNTNVGEIILGLIYNEGFWEYMLENYSKYLNDGLFLLFGRNKKTGEYQRLK